MKIGISAPNYKDSSEILEKPDGSYRIVYKCEKGRTRKVIFTKCSYCGDDLLYDSRKKDGDKFCNKECYHRFNNNYVNCDNCGIEFIRGKFHRENIKTGYNFCSRKCKEEQQTCGGLLQLPHYGADLAYRNKTIKYFGSKCSECDVSENHLLVIHHIDGDRKNNSLENLIVLCHNHHADRHSRLRNGKTVLDYKYLGVLKG